MNPRAPTPTRKAAQSVAGGKKNADFGFRFRAVPTPTRARLPFCPSTFGNKRAEVPAQLMRSGAMPCTVNSAVMSRRTRSQASGFDLRTTRISGTCGGNDLHTCPNVKKQPRLPTFETLVRIPSHSTLSPISQQMHLTAHQHVDSFKGRRIAVGLALGKEMPQIGSTSSHNTGRYQLAC